MNSDVAAILPKFDFRSTVRRSVALCSMNTREWPVPGFLAAPEPEHQRALF